MANDRTGVESVLSRLDDLSGRLPTAKAIGDIQEAVGRLATTKQVIELQETLTKIQADIKGVRNEMAELGERTDKSLRKLREEVLEAVENVEGPDGEETTEAIEKTVEKYVGEVKNLFKIIIGDDPETIGALRGRVRDWVGKKGKKAVGSGDVE